MFKLNDFFYICEERYHEQICVFCVKQGIKNVVANRDLIFIKYSILNRSYQNV